MLQHFSFITQVIELGIIMSFVSLGTFISSHLLDFNDLSIEGSFALGAATSVLLAQCNAPIIIQVLGSLAVGCLVGLLTSVLHFGFHINKIIAGLLTATAIFSINLKLVGPHALMPNGTSLFDITHVLGTHHKLIALLIIGTLGITLVSLFLKSEIGLIIRAAGDNPTCVQALGKNAAHYQSFGIMLSNALGALSGFLFTALTGFFSITGNVGILPIALASIILSNMSRKSRLFRIIIGSILYQFTITTCISLNIDPSWNKLITAGIILLLIAVRNTRTHKKDLV